MEESLFSIRKSISSSNLLFIFLALPEITPL